jgi:transposase
MPATNENADSPYDPQANRGYAEMAAYCDRTMLPTRPRRPRGKGKIEAAGLIVERWLFGRLRHRVFYSLAELNAAIAELMADLNDCRIVRAYGQTRRQLFEVIDKPALKATAQKNRARQTSRSPRLLHYIVSFL